MRGLKRQIITRQYIELVRDDDEIWSITRDQVLAMRQAMPLTQVIAEVKSSLALFLEVDPTDINRRLLFGAQQTGEMSLVLEFA